MNNEPAASPPAAPSSQDDLYRYLDASATLDSAQAQLLALQHSTAVETFNRQLERLRQRLRDDPRAFRELFIADGASAIVWEFQQDELSADFVTTLWDLLLRDDDASTVLMRFIWNVPLDLKRKFIRAIDRQLSARYPMFKGLSVNWPAQTHIAPHIRDAQQRATDFGLVNEGYLGYLKLGFSARDVDLFVWLEALRDRQCTDKPCEIGLRVAGRFEPRGGCPVRLHIPKMLELLGTGRFREALALIENAHPLPNVTGRICPQEVQCQGVCALHPQPIEIGQIEWYLPQREKLRHGDDPATAPPSLRFPDPWTKAEKPPVAVVGSGPAGLISAYLLAAEGFPVTVFEAFHALGGVLRYGIPEFRLPNELIDDVVGKIKMLGGKFVTNFVVGKTASLNDLSAAGFWKVFVGTGAGLPRFMNIPGEHLLNVMSANEFLTRVNLMQGHRQDYETPLPETRGKRVVVVGAGNTAMDAARTARRLGGLVTVVYRRTQAEMPVRAEELQHAIEEGIELKVLRSPSAFIGEHGSTAVTRAMLDVMALGAPDASGRRRPVATGQSESMAVELVIMALGNAPNPIIRDSEPDLKTSASGTIDLSPDSQQTSVAGVYSGGDATRGGSTAIRAAGDGQAAAREMIAAMVAEKADEKVGETVGKKVSDALAETVNVTSLSAGQISRRVETAAEYTRQGSAPPRIVEKIELNAQIVEFIVHSPLLAKAARAGQFVRLLNADHGELIPLTLADWDHTAGTLCLVVQAVGASTLAINRMAVGDAFAGIAGPLGRPSKVHRYAKDRTVVVVAGGLGLPPAYPIVREHLRSGNQVTLIAGFRNAGQVFWLRDDERIGRLQAEFRESLELIATSDDGSFGRQGQVSDPLEALLRASRQNRHGQGRQIAEVIAIGPPLMMRAVSELTRPYGVRTVVSLNSIMVDATGMCGACMVPLCIDGKMVRQHACIDGPEMDGHHVDWDKLLPRFDQFKPQQQASMIRHHFP